MEDGQRRVPVVRADEPLEGGDDAVEELADRLAAQEARLVRNHSPERMHELALERVRRDVGEPAALDLAKLGPGLGIELRRDDRGRLERARQPARHDAVDLDAAERLGHGRRLRDPFLVQGHLRRVHGHSVLGEVGHLGVAHQVQAAAHALHRIAPCRPLPCPQATSSRRRPRPRR